MKRLAPISVYCLVFSWLSLSWSPRPVNSNDYSAHALEAGKLFSDPVKANPNEAFITSLYTEMNLESKGLSKAAFELAYNGYQELLENKKLDVPGMLSICDFSQSSRKKRLYILDLEKNEVVFTTYVAHGKNSGFEYASRFSNRAESHQSSLGFYVTSNTYFGEHGLSLRLNGVDKGFNDRALRRNIVVHGATYIGPGSTGRSYGCPAVPKAESAKIINLIKNGTCLFIYHPSKYYLKGSKILNG